MNKSVCNILSIALFALLWACGERIVVSDVGFLDLHFKVKTMDENFYLAYNSFNNIILQKKIYECKYEFDYDCRYKSIEKQLFLNANPSVSANDSMRCDSAYCDSLRHAFPFAMKEPDYIRINYRYDSDTVTVAEFYDKDGNLTSYIHKLHKNNRLLAEEEFLKTGKPTVKTGFWYDERGRMTNRTKFYETSYSETLYAYSHNEKLETDNEMIYRYRYDLDGKITNKKTYKGITLVSETDYFYDNGNVVVEQEISREGEIKKTLYEYVYDSKNNWTVCLEYNHSGNIFVRTRSISYY